MYKKIFKIIPVVFVLLFAGCSLKKAATTTIGKIAVDGTQVIESERDVDLARETTPSLIITLEVLSRGNPDDKRMLTLLARSYGQYAFGFLEEDIIRYKGIDEQNYKKALARADLFYEKGKDYGLRALWSLTEQEKILSLPQDEFERHLKKFGKSDVPALFWAAFCWGNWINLHRDDPKAFIYVPRVKAIMERVVELDSTYYFGSAHSFLGAMAVSRPAMLGGDPPLSQKEFDEAVNIDKDYFMHKVLYAQYYAVQTNNISLFERLLQEVEAADLSVNPSQYLANALAKQRAKLLLNMKGRYF